MTETASEAGARIAASLSRMQSHADLSVGAVLRSGLASVPDQHGRWLMAFLRDRLPDAEYRAIRIAWNVPHEWPGDA